MTYTQICMMFEFTVAVLDEHNKRLRNKQKGKSQYLQGMIHGIYSMCDFVGCKIELKYKPTGCYSGQFYECVFEYKCHRLHRMIKCY